MQQRCCESLEVNKGHTMHRKQQQSVRRGLIDTSVFGTCTLLELLTDVTAED
jgi:hypothetical protein